MKRFLLLFLVIGLGVLFSVLLGTWFLNLLDRSATSPTRIALLARSRSSKVYSHADNEWLNFSLAAAKGDTIRCLSTANLKPDVRVGALEELRYSFHVQIEDTAGYLVVDQLYHFRNRLATGASPYQEVSPSDSFYLQDDLLPMASKVLLLNVRGMKGLSRLRIRITSMDSRIQLITFRAYGRDPVTDHQLSYAWRSLTPGQKLQLADNLVYPPELLTKRERENLIRTNWRPLGALGSAGHHYRVHRLYRLTKGSGESDAEEPLPAALFVAAGSHITLPIATNNTNVRLEYSDAPMGLAPEESSMQLVWHPAQDIGSNLVTQQVATSRTGVYEGTFDQGLIELHASAPLLLHAFTVHEGQKRLLFLEPTSTELWSLGGEQRLRYTVSHEGDLPASCRLHVRLQMARKQHEPMDETRDGLVHCRFLDEHGTEVHKLRLLMQVRPSTYDRHRSLFQDRSVTDNETFFFHLPPEVREVEFAAEQDTLLQLFTRPAKLTRSIQIPTLWHNFAPDVEQRQLPSWFPLKPNGREELEAAGRAVLIDVQERPKEAVADKLGRWEIWIPAVDTVGRELFLRRGAGVAWDVRKKAKLFAPLVGKRKISNAMSYLDTQKPFNPTLVTLASSVPEESITQVFTNDQLWAEYSIQPRQSLAMLPPLPAGNHQVRVQGPPTATYYLNFPEETDDVWVRRYGLRITEKITSVPYTKESYHEEVLQVRLFVPWGQSSPTVVHADIRGMDVRGVGPWKSYTLEKRIYHISPDPSEKTYVLGTDNLVLGHGRTLYIRFGQDLPPGTYPVEFQIQDPTGPTFVSFSRRVYLASTEQNEP